MTIKFHCLVDKNRQMLTIFLTNFCGKCVDRDTKFTGGSSNRGTVRGPSYCDRCHTTGRCVLPVPVAPLKQGRRASAGAMVSKNAVFCQRLLDKRRCYQ